MIRTIIILLSLEVATVCTALNWYLTFGPVTYPVHVVEHTMVKDLFYIKQCPGPDSKVYKKDQTPAHIILHSTANTKPTGTAMFHVDYLNNSNRQTSWHFTVDDKDVIQHYPITKTTWGAMSCNHGGINIEVCQYEGMDVQKALDNLELLLKELPDLPIRSHKSCTGKNCPSLPELWSFL